MAIITGQLAVTTAAQLFIMPPGPCTICLSVTGANPGFVGTSANVTTSNGFSIPVGAQPVVIAGTPGSRGGPIFGVSVGCTFSWMISTDG